jgi:hypothetical protein
MSKIISSSEPDTIRVPPLSKTESTWVVERQVHVHYHHERTGKAIQHDSLKRIIP